MKDFLCQKVRCQASEVAYAGLAEGDAPRPCSVSATREDRRSHRGAHEPTASDAWLRELRELREVLDAFQILSDPFRIHEKHILGKGTLKELGVLDGHEVKIVARVVKNQAGWGSSGSVRAPGDLPKKTLPRWGQFISLLMLPGTKGLQIVTPWRCRVHFRPDLA